MPFVSSSRKLSTTILLIIFVAISYFCLGLLGIQLAIPPSQAGTVWPPAGIALAATLIYGLRICPGIFIGNFCISAWAFGFNSASLVIYFATAMGATLNAYLAFHLIHRYIGLPNDLIKEKDIIQFLLIGGPLCCLIPATIGIGSMYLAGIIAFKEVLANWFSWWVGDTIGVLIFTPMILTLFNNKRPIWQRRKYTLTLPLLITFLLVVFFFFYIQKLEHNRQQQHFIAQSKHITQSITSRFQNHISNVQSLNSFYQISHHIEPQEFSSFTHATLKQFPEIELIRWIQYVPDKGLITKYAEKKQDSSIDPNYIPEHLLTLLAHNFILSSPLSGFLREDQKTQDLFTTTYKNTKNKSITPIGIIAISIAVDDLINNVLKNTDIQNINLSIVESDSGKQIFNNSDSSVATDTLKHSVNLASQNWIFQFSYNKNIDNQSHWSMWGVLFSGLLFTSLLGTFLLLLTGRHFTTETIVKERTAELLAAKNHAEESNQAKSRIISNISHELRTPLNGILGFTHLLQNKSYITTEDHKKLNIIDHCSNHLLTLINDLLFISKINTHKINPSYQEFNFIELIDEVTSIFRLKSEEKGLVFIVNNTHHVDIITSDQKALRQIIENLLSNAVKFTAYGYIKFSISNDDQFITFTIEDTGCGISEKNLELIFSPFVQIDDTQFSKEGVGLGLAISQELITLLKGKITVTSQVNLGSTFTVKIPFIMDTSKQQTLITINRSLAENDFKINILVADDNEINVLLLSHILDGIQCQYDTANNGLEALNLLKEKPYQLALIDLNMPVMSGMELIKDIKKHNISVKTVAISAYADKNKIDMALNTGFDHYLTKPIDANDIKKLIANMGKTNETS